MPRWWNDDDHHDDNMMVVGDVNVISDWMQCQKSAMPNCPSQAKGAVLKQQLAVMSIPEKNENKLCKNEDNALIKMVSSSPGRLFTYFLDHALLTVMPRRNGAEPLPISWDSNSYYIKNVCCRSRIERTNALNDESIVDNPRKYGLQGIESLNLRPV